MSKYQYEGIIKSGFLCNPITNVKVTAKNKNNNVLFTILSDEEGKWKVKSDEEIYKISFERNEFVRKEIIVGNKTKLYIRLLENKIIGYQDKLWFLPGEKVNVYVNSTVPYKVKLLHHGLVTDTILDLGSHQPTVQVLPDDKFVQEGLNWNKSFSYNIPEDVKPGFYSLDLRISNDDYYRLSFLVSTKSEFYGKNKVLLLASTNNWQTYNIWGGRSRYRNFEQDQALSLKDKLMIMASKTLPTSVKEALKELAGNKIITSINDHPNAWQFKPLSVKRPHPNCSIIDNDPYKPFISHLTAGEWRVAAWLEREGYEYDVVSGFQLHHNPELLNNYESVILSTHCEYWSKEMYSGLKEYHEKGGSILNLSGNSIYREITFPDDDHIQCLSLRFEKSVSDETKLIGVRFDMRGYGNCSPYKVIDNKHWVFEGTGVENGYTFAPSSLNKPSGTSEGEDFNPGKPGMLTELNGDGGSGWETDKLSDTAPKDIQLVAKGINKKDGGADMIVREAKEGRGLLFSASSITFGGSLLIDDISSKIVNNVLQKISSLKKKTLKADLMS